FRNRAAHTSRRHLPAIPIFPHQSRSAHSAEAVPLRILIVASSAEQSPSSGLYSSLTPPRELSRVRCRFPVWSGHSLRQAQGRPCPLVLTFLDFKWIATLNGSPP